MLRQGKSNYKPVEMFCLPLHRTPHCMVMSRTSHERFWKTVQHVQQSTVRRINASRIAKTECEVILSRISCQHARSR